VSQLKMPKKGQSAQMMAQLQAEHASSPVSAPDDVQSAATPVTTLQPAPVAPNVGTNLSTHAPTHPSTNDAADHTAIDFPPQPAITAEALAPSADGRSRRLDHALDQANTSEMAVVTVRVPASLNRYMDAYTARLNQIDPKRRVRKQDCVLYAFASFYADHPMPPAPDDDEL